MKNKETIERNKNIHIFSPSIGNDEDNDKLYLDVLNSLVLLSYYYAG